MRYRIGDVMMEVLVEEFGSGSSLAVGPNASIVRIGARSRNISLKGVDLTKVIKLVVSPDKPVSPAEWVKTGYPEAIVLDSICEKTLIPSDY